MKDATLGRYERLERLGAGGMAVVWRALDRKLHREVALKELRDEAALAPDGIARFRHEAEAIARLAHPNVVAFYDAADEGARTVLVMELVRGESLAQRLEKRPTLRPVVEVLEKAARGVQHAHEHGVVHRDLKPSNILIGADGEPKVGDFGLAHLSGALVTTLTRTGTVLGTPAYMAPEQARGDRAAIGPRTDVWALGAILYEVLAKRPPFVGDSIHALVHEVLTAEPEEPRALDPTVPLDLQTIALKCLSKEPERRYATAIEVAEELHRWLDGRPIVARPPSATELAVLWVRRNSKLAVLFAALAAAIVGVAIAWGSRARYEGLARKMESEVRAASDAALAEKLSRERAVLAEIEKARAATPDEGAVDRLVALASDRTVELLVGVVTSRTDELAQVTREVYLQAKDPTPDEARAGAKPLVGLEEVLDRVFSTGDAGEEDEKLIVAASNRLEERAIRSVPRSSDVKPIDIDVILSTAQERAQPSSRRAALLAVEALGRIGGTRARELAVPVLSRWLGVVQSEHDAALAGEALARIGGAEADRTILAAAERFGKTSLFWLRVQPLFEGHDALPVKGKTTAEELKKSGIRRAAARDFEGAIADLTSAIALDPKDAFSWYNRACARFEQRDVDGALFDASRAIALLPKDAGFLGFRGHVRDARGDLEGALVDLDKALALDPESRTSLVYRGLARTKAGDPKGAIADLTSAIVLEPNDLAAWNNRGIAKKAAGDMAGAIADWTHSLEMDPNNVPALGNRASLESSMGQHAAAIRDFDRALELQPRYVEALLGRGITHRRLRNPEAAIADFSRAIELRPRNPQGWWVRGQARHDAGDLAGAIADVKKAHELAPRRAEYVGDLATLERLAGDLDAALRDFSRAIELDPKNGLIWRNRAAVRDAKGDHEGAIDDATRAHELMPKLVSALTQRAISRAGAGDEEGAFVDANRAIELDPTDVDVWFTRGSLFGIFGKHAEAIEDFGRAIELGPKNGDLWANRAALRLLAGDREKAIADATHSLELLPRQLQALETRGTARAAQGDAAGARADLERYLEIAPAGSASENVRQTLKGLEGK